MGLNKLEYRHTIGYYAVNDKNRIFTHFFVFTQVFCSYNKYSLSTYHALGTVSGSRNL